MHSVSVYAEQKTREFTQRGLWVIVVLW